MIFQGLFNILDLYLNDSEIFYKSVDNFFQKAISNIEFNVNEIESSLEAIVKHITIEFIDLGFSKKDIENKFLDPFIKIRNKENEKKNNTRKN